MSESTGSRAVYGKAIGSGLVGLAGLAAQGLLASDAQAESAPIRVMTSESKHKDWFDLSLAFPGNPNGVHIAPTGDLDGDSIPDVIVGSPVGSGDALAVLGVQKDKMQILEWTPGSNHGMRAANYMKIPAPPAPIYGIVSAAASGPSGHVKLSGWDRTPNSPPVVFDEQNAFPGQTMRSGVHVASGDLDGDGIAEFVAGTSGDVGLPGALPASSYIKIGSVDGEANDAHIKFQPELYPYGQTYRGGIRVATGDVDGDGSADLVTVGDFGDHSTIRVFGEGSKDWPPRLLSTYDVDTSTSGGVSVAVGDLNGDGRAELVSSRHKDHKGEIEILSWSFGDTGPEGGLMQWNVVNTLQPYGPGSGYDGGFNLAVFDATGDGLADIFVAPASVVPEPASLGLIGAASMGLRRRRRRTD